MSANVSTSGAGLEAGGLFTPAAVQASAYTANPGELVPVDTTTGAVTVTLPAAPADGTTIAVKMVVQGSTHAVTVAAAGADTFNKAAGSTTLTLALLYEGVILQYKAAIAVWYVLSDDIAPGSFGASSFSGVVTENGGTDTAGSAPAITPTFANGTASQLADLTRDYMVYLQIGTAGTAFSLKIGPTSTPATTVFASATPAAEQMLSVRLPAGWYLEWAGSSTTIASQAAVGC
jgi:hypothetical protein